MSDPFLELRRAIQPIFHLAAKPEFHTQKMENGEYIYSELLHLQNFLGQQLSHKNQFYELVNTLHNIIPLIMTQITIDSNTIRDSLTELAEEFNTSFNWELFLSPNAKAFTFRYSSQFFKSEASDLLAWLVQKEGLRTKPESLHAWRYLLVRHHETLGFSPKLNEHLLKDPEFLFRIIMDTEENFRKICRTQIILHLTDVQIAQAIVKHHSKWFPNTLQSPITAQIMISKINEFLTHGRSYITLVRNDQAKLILDNVDVFKKPANDNTNYTFQA